MAILKLNSTNVITESNNVATIDNNVVFPAGHVVQVVSQNFTGTASRSSSSYIDTFLTKSTVETKETIKWDDGKEYPLCKIVISNKSHPFFTGKQNLVDTAGRIEKFNKKYERK